MLRTPLYGEHVALGARIVPFAGFEMPVQYAGILQEHDAVRTRAGVFDLSHMAQFELRGDGVGAWGDRLTVNTLASMKPGGARYNLFCNDAGGAHDDVIFYRLEDRWLLVCNAANAEKMWALLSAALEPGVELADRRRERALIAVQGPRALELIAPHVDGQPEPMRYYTCEKMNVFNKAAVVARTGYTGEDGFELFVAADDAVFIWRELLEAGRTSGVAPCGLGARDVLRLEAGMPLYGHELGETITPLQAGLAWAVKFEKPDFTGRAALERQRDGGAFARIVGLVMEGRVPARAGYTVLHDGRAVGAITSGSLGPSVGRNIATALVDAEFTAPGTKLSVEIRSAAHAAEVVTLPFYKRKR
jgi:aminomethyltransferase